MLQAKVIKLRGSINSGTEYFALGVFGFNPGITPYRQEEIPALLQIPCWQYERMEEPEKFFSGLAAKINGEGGDVQ